MACFREIQDDDGNEYFTVQDDAYGYNADSQCVFVMLESGWEGYTLAVVCPTYSDAKFVVTDDDTGEEYHYSTREALMEEEFLQVESPMNERKWAREHCSECVRTLEECVCADGPTLHEVEDEEVDPRPKFLRFDKEESDEEEEEEEESDESDEEEDEEEEGEWCSAKCEEDEGCRKCNPFAFQTTDEMATYLNNKL
jgi:hypothetical protein